MLCIFRSLKGHSYSCCLEQLELEDIARRPNHDSRDEAALFRALSSPKIKSFFLHGPRQLSHSAQSRSLAVAITTWTIHDISGVTEVSLPAVTEELALLIIYLRSTPRLLVLLIRACCYC
jgi:hypothetical protein